MLLMFSTTHIPGNQFCVQVLCEAIATIHFETVGLHNDVQACVCISGLCTIDFEMQELLSLVLCTSSLNHLRVGRNK